MFAHENNTAAFCFGGSLGGRLSVTWCHLVVTLEAFWGHAELKNRLGRSRRALFALEVDFLGSTPPILKRSGEFLGLQNDF